MGGMSGGRGQWGRGQGGRGKGKGAISLGAVVTSVVRQRMGKALQCRLAAHCQWVGVPAPPALLT